MTSAAPPHTGRSTHVGTLTIDVRTHTDGRALLAPRGELVRGCADALSEALAGLPSATVRVDVNMAGVTFMDSAGLGFLETLGEHGRCRFVRVTATGWAGQPRRILELAGLNTADPLRPADGPPAAGQPASPAASAVASAVAVERAERLLQLQQEVEQLRRAIASRPVIDQARGILMAAHGCTPEQAWDILREASQRSNTKLRTVAEAVTAGARPGGPVPPEEIRAALRTAVTRTTATSGAPPEA